MSLDSWNEIRSAAERAVRQGRYDDAGKLWVQAAAMCSELDRYDGRRIVTLEGLAGVYWHTNKFADALPILETTFAIHEEQLGPDHRDIGVLANNLARLYHTLERFPEAEGMYKRALRIQRKALGVEHPDVVELIKNYANLLVAEGKGFEAEDLKASTVSVKSGVWNRSGYFKTIQIDSEDSLFAQVESSAPDYSAPAPPHSAPAAKQPPQPLAAEPSLRLALPASQPTPPPAPVAQPNYSEGWAEAPVDSPSFGAFDFVPPRAASLPNSEAFELGALLANDPATQNPASQNFATQNPATQYPTTQNPTTQNPATQNPATQNPAIQYPATQNPATQNLATPNPSTEEEESTISDAEKSAETNELSAWLSARKVAPAQEAQTKPESWNELFHKAMAAMQQNNTLQAEQLLKNAVAATEEFELTDPRTASTLELYSEALWKNGKLSEAEPVCERTLHIYAMTLEPDHQDIGVVANNLAMLYHALDKPEKAEPLYKRSLAVRSKNQGASHPDVIMLLNNYANMLYVWHREGEAVNLKNHIRSLSSGKWNQVGKFKALNLADVSQAREDQSKTFSKFKPSMQQAIVPTKEEEETPAAPAAAVVNRDYDKTAPDARIELAVNPTPVENQPTSIYEAAVQSQSDFPNHSVFTGQPNQSALQGQSDFPNHPVFTGQPNQSAIQGQSDFPNQSAIQGQSDFPNHSVFTGQPNQTATQGQSDFPEHSVFTGQPNQSAVPNQSAENTEVAAQPNPPEGTGELLQSTEDALTRFSESESNYNNDPRAVLKNLVDGFRKKPTD